MRLKHILFSGLFLSTAFVACTNEDFEDLGAQDVTGKAISLGENFTISGGFGAETRAVYGEDAAGNVKSLWEPEDQVGGAWYAALTKVDKTNGNQGYFFNGGYFASNHPYSRKDKTGNVANAEFVTNTNSFAGKYALYFPYNEKVAATSDAIPVSVETAQTMDVANPLAHISKKENFFAYTNAEYEAGGNQVQDFKLSAVPVLYRIYFKANNDTKAIVGKTISMVIVEAENVSDEKGSFYSEGAVTVDTKDGVYKKAEAVYNGKAGKETNVITLTVTGNEGNADYRISAVGDEGVMKKPFYIAALPANKDISKLTFTVVTTDGKVFKRVVDGLETEDYKDVRESVTTEGGYFNKRIELKAVGENNDDIYTVKQFENAWAKAVEEGEGTIRLGAPMSLETLSLETTGAEISIEGKKLTVETLTVNDGTLDVENLEAEELNVGMYGVLNVTDATKVTGATVIGGIVDLKGVESMAGVTVRRKGSLALTGKAKETTPESYTQVTGAVSTEVDADLTLKDIELAGPNNFTGRTHVANAGTVKFVGVTTVKAGAEIDGAATAAAATFVGELVNNGTIKNANIGTTIFNKLTNNGTLDFSTKAVVFGGNTVNNATLKIASGNVVNAGTFTNRGTLDIADDATLKNGDTSTNPAKVGTMTLDNGTEIKEGSDGDVVNASNSVLNIKCADGLEGETPAPANLNVKNNGTMKVELASANKEVTFASLTNATTTKMEISKGKAIVPKAMELAAGGEIYVAAEGKMAYNAEEGQKATNATAGLLIVATSDEQVIKANAGQVFSAYYATTPAENATQLIVNSEATVKFNEGYSYILRANVKLKESYTMVDNQTITVEGKVILTGYTTTTDQSDKILKVYTGQGNNLSVKDKGILEVGAKAKIDGSGAAVNTRIIATEGAIINTGA